MWDGKYKYFPGKSGERYYVPEMARFPLSEKSPWICPDRYSMPVAGYRPKQVQFVKR